MTFCLDTKIIGPENSVEIKNAIILLHGYGGDGNDISMLTLNWKRHLPQTVFLCPNGHESCPINPTGFQWFDLTKEDPAYILEQSKKAEKKLNEFISMYKNNLVSLNTVVFNNLVNTVGEYKLKWEVPVKESWHNRFMN